MFYILVFSILFLSGCQGNGGHVIELLQSGTGMDVGPWVNLVSLEPFRVCITWLSAIPKSFVVMTGWDAEHLDEELKPTSDGVVHRVYVDVPCEKTLYYQVKPDLECCSGEVFSISAPPSSDSLKIAVLGDMQPRDDSTLQSNRLMLDAVRRVAPDLVIQVGDILERGSEIKNWGFLMQVLPQLASGVPMALVPGNHDLKYDEGANWDLGFGQTFIDGLDGRHRILRQGNIRFFMLEAFYGPLSTHDYEWLSRELLKAQEEACWRFVFFHGSIISTGTENTDIELQRQLVPLFDQTKVHAVFYGHDHFYEHYQVSYGPWLFNPKDRPTGHMVHYFLTGGGGARLEHEYGLLERPEKVRKQVFVNAETHKRKTFRFGRRPWNPNRVNTLADPGWAINGQACYQVCSEECYQDDAVFWGHEYGENVLHYITLEIGKDEASVEVHYPDGSLLTGPAGDNPQSFLINRLT